MLEELALPLSVSHEILPEFREYERASTVVINAYLQPLMQSYLHSLRTRIAEQSSKHSRVFIMQSSGGTTALESAVHQPVRTVLSGPAGGIVGATVMAQAQRLRRHHHLRHGRHLDRRRPGARRA